MSEDSCLVRSALRCGFSGKLVCRLNVVKIPAKPRLFAQSAATRQLMCAGRRFARVEEAPSRDALRGILRGDAKRALDCAFAHA